TNIVFETEEELDSFVMKLAQRTGKTVSAAQPLLDGTLPDGSRVQITYGKDIARRGSNFSIRKFTKEPLTPVDLINYGTANEEIFAYLWSAIESQLSILVAGGTATGKTTLLNAIALFIKPEMKIVSIEDTAELQLPHPNWIPQVARVGFGPSNYGAIDMFDLLKAALRQRPDYIIVGEVRGKEAYVLFQGIATGHPALGTIHADSMRAIIDRLTSPPINLPMVLLENLDIAVFMTRTRVKGEYVRRVASIEEIIGYNYRKKMIEWIKSFEWDPASDTFISHKSYILRKIMESKGLKEEEFREDLKFKRDILSWLRKNNIRNYKEIAKYIELYYYEPEKLSKIIYGTI
ncbi:MAG TPA: type IV secretion system protein VirB11, partial [Pyrodictium sp.]|nr:type IV secretion system protein VirB11 [Pyrodictium sp.]